MLAITPDDAYALLALFAEFETKLVERVVAETARLAMEPEATPAGRQLAALNRLSQQLLPLGFAHQSRPLAADGEPAALLIVDDSVLPPDVTQHRHPGLLPSQCPECSARLTAAGRR